MAILGRHCRPVQAVEETYTPIASVAALSERHTGWQYTLHCFYGARSPDLSLRGPIGAVAISCNSLRFRRWLSCAPDGYCEIATSGFRPPRNDKPVCLTPPNHRPNTCYCQRRSQPARGTPHPQGGKAANGCAVSAATDAIGVYVSSTACMGRQCLPEIATSAAPPRNDKSGSPAPLNLCRLICGRPWRSMSAAANMVFRHAKGALRICSAPG